MNAREILQKNIDMYAQIGHPAIIERFVLRNGKEFKGSPFTGRRWKAKECFRNATINQAYGTYVEGYAFRPSIGLPILHAWCVKDSKVIDGTLDAPETCFYIGVEFPEKEVWKVLNETGYYGLLDPMMINTKLIFEMDPELKAITEQITGMKL